jgi:hypothetical protein
LRQDLQVACIGTIACADNLQVSPLRRKKRASGRDDTVSGNEKAATTLFPEGTRVALQNFEVVVIDSKQRGGLSQKPSAL